MSELKPCPFCGNKLIKKCSQQLPGLSSPAFWFKCDCCGAESGPSKNRPESITGWNFRAESPELAALREQVKVLRNALEGARIFIVDGLEFWCVKQPEPGEQAFDALNGIYRALAQTKPKDGE